MQTWYNEDMTGDGTKPPARDTAGVNASLNVPQRIGVLGGTFNPVHNRHIEIAERVCALFSLDGVLLMVAGDPPHKSVEGAVRARARYEMARRASLCTQCLTVSDLEVRRQGKSYTFDTLTQLRALLPQAEIYLIVGGDMLFDMDCWYRAEELFRLAVIVAIPRETLFARAEEFAAHLKERYAADIRVLDIALSPISSTMVRERVRNALPINALVPAEVEKYIYQTGLYLPEDVRGLFEKCRAALPSRRFNHTMGVVRAAVTLAHRYKVDGEKARLAALLHDYGRSVEHDALLHAPSGARLAKETLGIADEEILNAIRVHTTLRPGATALEKIIYLADIIEAGRDFSGVDAIRKRARRDLDGAVLMGLERTFDYLKRKNLPVARESIEAREYLVANPPRGGDNADI